MTDYLWRSLLYVAGHVEKYVLKAAHSGADVVILELEDSVPPESKQMARDLLTVWRNRTTANALAISG